MKRHQFDHLLRAAAVVFTPSPDFLVLGSQAILAHLDSAYFESNALFMSSELDVAAYNVSQEEEEEASHYLSGVLGLGSAFEQMNGYYIDGVSTKTAIFAPGWHDRLIKVPVEGASVWAPSFEDLLISKLMAGRDKDLAFVEAMIDTSHPALQTVSSLLESFDPTTIGLETAKTRWAVRFSRPHRSMPQHRP